MARDRGWGQLSMSTHRGEVSPDVLGVETGSPESIPYHFPRDHIGKKTCAARLSKHTGDCARSKGPTLASAGTLLSTGCSGTLDTSRTASHTNSRGSL